MHGLFLSYFDIILSIKQPRFGHIQFAYGYSLFVYICVQTADLSQGHITSPSLQVRSDKLFVGNSLHVRVCGWNNNGRRCCILPHGLIHAKVRPGPELLSRKPCTLVCLKKIKFTKQSGAVFLIYLEFFKCIQRCFQKMFFSKIRSFLNTSGGAVFFSINPDFFLKLHSEMFFLSFFFNESGDFLIHRRCFFFNKSGAVYFNKSGAVYFNKSGDVYFTKSRAVYFNKSGDVYFTKSGAVFFNKSELKKKYINGAVFFNKAKRE